MRKQQTFTEMKRQTNNPNGRPLGVPNKVTATLKEKINLVVENNIDQIQTDLDSLEPKDRLSIMLKLIEYVLPKQKEVMLDTSPQFGYQGFEEEEYI